MFRPVVCNGSGGVRSDAATIELEPAGSHTIRGAPSASGAPLLLSSASATAGPGTTLTLRGAVGSQGNGAIDLLAGSVRAAHITDQGIAADVAISVGTGFSATQTAITMARPTTATSVIHAQGDLLIESSTGVVAASISASAANFSQPFTARLGVVTRPPTSIVGQDKNYVFDLPTYTHTGNDGTYWGYFRINGTELLIVEVGSTYCYQLENIAIRSVDTNYPWGARVNGYVRAINNVASGVVIGRQVWDVDQDAGVGLAVVAEVVTVSGQQYLRIRLQKPPEVAGYFYACGKMLISASYI
jgi:hypothetical protein